MITWKPTTNNIFRPLKKYTKRKRIGSEIPQLNDILIINREMALVASAFGI